MEKNKKTRNIEDEKPPDYNEVCPPIYPDSFYLPSIKIQIRRLIQNILTEEEDEKIYQELKEQKEMELRKKVSKDETEDTNQKEELKNSDDTIVDYEKIVNKNNEILREMNQDISELSNIIQVLFNEIEIITANPNIHSKGKIYKLTYFVRNYIPLIKEKFKKFRSKHLEDERLEKIKSQIYFSYKLYFDIVIDYVKENYEIRMSDEKIENYDEK